MKKRVGAIVAAGAIALCLTLGVPAAAGEWDTSPKVGTFDSRAVALAYWRSGPGMEKLEGLHREMEEAKAAGDEKRVQELEVEGPGLQVRMHQQVFSTGTVSDIIRKVEAEIPAIAESAGVSMIVSKWEIAYRDPGVEYVDVTPQLVDLFHPDDEIRKMIKKMEKQKPVPIDELSMDPMH
jgi:hypothetical protein